MWYVFGLVCELLYIWNHLLNKKSSKNRASTHCKTVSMSRYYMSKLLPIIYTQYFLGF